MGFYVSEKRGWMLSSDRYARRLRIIIPSFIFVLFVAFLLTLNTALARESNTYEALGMSSIDVELDLSNAILQSGGLVRDTPSVQHEGIMTSSGSDLTTQADINNSLAQFRERAMRAIDSWNGKDSRVELDMRDLSLTYDNVKTCFAEMINNNPQYFYVSSVISGQYNSNNKNMINCIIDFDTRYTRADIAKFEQAAEEILLGVSARFTQEENALYLHDSLVLHCEYDSTMTKASAYDALVDKKAICQGYSLAYVYLLKKAGIPSTIVTSEGYNHAWNIVWIDNVSYCVDTTYDDPIDLNLTYCSHANFLIDKSTFQMNHRIKNQNGTFVQHRDWRDAAGRSIYNDNTIGTSERYKYAFWRGVIAAIPSVDRKFAYIKSPVNTSALGSQMWIHDYVTGKDAPIANLAGIWTLWDSTSFYDVHFNNIISDGEKFLVSTPRELIQITPEGKVLSTYTVNNNDITSKGYIYGLLYSPNKVNALMWQAQEPFTTNGYQTPYYFPFKYPVIDIAIRSLSSSVEVGSFLTMTAVFHPWKAKNKNVTWSTSDPRIATVDNKGVVSAKEPGSVMITVTAHNGLKAQYPLQVYAGPRLIADAKISIPSVTYNGHPQYPPVTVVANGTTLVKDKHYQVIYSNNTNAGQGRATIKGINGIKGEKTISFTINKAQISSANITKLASRTYTGKAIKPIPLVSFAGVGLRMGADYAVSYANNKKAGKARVTVTGAGNNFTGSKTITFTINKAANPLKCTAKTVKITKKKGKSTTLSLSAYAKVKKKGKGKITYKNVSAAKLSKYIKVNTTSGKITVTSKVPAGKHYIKVRIKAAGTSNYKSKTVTLSIPLVVK